MPESIVLSQGDELTTGQTVDTNSHFIAGHLWESGVPVRRVIAVPDRLDDLVAVIREAALLAPVVVCTGGLGPTRDDLTAEAAAAAFGLPLLVDDQALAHVVGVFARWGREMSEANRKQALLPAGARILDNPHGTAVGFALDRERSSLWFLPGVPREMRPMFTELVLPDIAARLALRPSVRHVVRVHGVPESRLEMLTRDLDVPGLDPGALSVGFRTHLPENQVKLVFAPDVPEALRAATVRLVLSRVGPQAFGVDTGDLAEVVGGALASRGETLALAESCTAGRLAAWVGGVPGASRYLLEGAVAYSNEAKTRTCGVPAALIAEHGAVSEPVARGLARGIRERAGATWGIGVTGIAGPTGGTPEKPVGTVHVAVDGPGVAEHRHLRLPGDREMVTRMAAGSALYLLFRAIRPAT